MENDTALDDEESLGMDVTDQETVLPTGGTVSEELEQVWADKGCAWLFFKFYANLLSEDAPYQWDKIVASQVYTAPWTNVQGKEQP